MSIKPFNTLHHQTLQQKNDQNTITLTHMLMKENIQVQ